MNENILLQALGNGNYQHTFGLMAHKFPQPQGCTSCGPQPFRKWPVEPLV